ncbi:MAG: hypothetical protein ACRD20_00700 [Terriglobales bacterium]
MRGYAKISPQFWIGDTGRKLRDAGQEATLVGLYLLSNPHANMLGLYYLPKLFIAHETGLGLGGASKGLRRAIDAAFCSYDDASEMVFIHEMARYQIAHQLAASDKQCAGIQREYDGLPNNPFLSAFYKKYTEAFHLTNRRDNGRVSEGPSMALQSQEQEHEQEQDINTLPQTTFADGPEPLSGKPKSAKPTDAQVDQLYRLYPRKRDKFKAQKAIRKAVSVVMAGDPDHTATPLVDALDYLAQRVTLYGQRVRGCEPDFIPYPATWFNAGSFWDDEREWGRKPNGNGKNPHAPQQIDYVLSQDEAARRAGLEAARMAGTHN